MTRDGSSHFYLKCIVCGRPFLAYRSRLLNSQGRFCSRRCFRQSLKVYSQLLASGELARILTMPICREILDRGARSVEEPLYE